MPPHVMHHLSVPLQYDQRVIKNLSENLKSARLICTP